MNQSLLRIGYILTLIFGILETVMFVIFGGLTRGTGLIVAIIPIAGLILFYKFYKDGEELMESDPEQAKSKLIISSIISLLFVSRIGGILMLIGVLLD